MPRAKKTLVAKVAPDQPTSSDAALPVDATPATPATEFAVGTLPPAEEEKVEKPKSTRARKPKPCERCDERRRREREYARASRQRGKGAKPASHDDAVKGEVVIEECAVADPAPCAETA
jgi:hypothetical protein